MPDHHRAAQTQPRAHMAKLAVAMSGLVQIHVVHVDFAPGNVAVKLGMQVHKGLVQRGQPLNPHLGGAEGMQPENI